ncbi:hypothetical protein LZ32DRAFT_619753 [Colletotrichum eremochloae]|nr:hypothetical protein LZ32DRAFT_619753 [Colletotrichum eremochloae]
MVETMIHNQCNRGVDRLIEQAILNGAAAVGTCGLQQGSDPDVVARLSRRLSKGQSNGSVKAQSRGLFRRKPTNRFIDRDANSSGKPAFVVKAAYRRYLVGAKLSTIEAQRMTLFDDMAEAEAEAEASKPGGHDTETAPLHLFGLDFTRWTLIRYQILCYV